MKQETLTPGTASFLEALADLLTQRGDEKFETLPEDGGILSKAAANSPFELIRDGLSFLEIDFKGELVGDVIDAMGITNFVCPGSGRVVDGDNARLGFALGIGSDRKGATMTGAQVADAVRGIIDVLPRCTE